MYSKSEHIVQLHKDKSTYSSPSTARDIANSLEALSSDIYTTSTRFIYELLQNADDASAASGQLDMLMTFEEDYLIIAHNGEPFSEIDVEAICSVGDGNKTGDDQKTGFKGIGFKSVFAHSDYVGVASGGFQFAFNKERWSTFWGKNWGSRTDWVNKRINEGRDTSIKMPWQIIPDWENSLPAASDYVDRYKVITVIRYDDTLRLEREIVEMLEHIQVLLFLRSQKVQLQFKGKEYELLLEKTKNEDEETLLKRDGAIVSKWLLKHKQFEVSAELKKQLGNDMRIPKKLRTANRTEISFAAQLEDGEIKRVPRADRLIFTYLPTSVNYDFPFLVNSSFLTDAGRQQLHDDLYWNSWLFEQMGVYLFEWLAELAEQGYGEDILNLIPAKQSSSYKVLQAFQIGFNEGLDKTPFLANQEGKLLKASEAILDVTRLHKDIGEEVTVALINKQDDTHYSVDSFLPSYEKISVLKRLGVRVFELEDMLLTIRLQYFRSKYEVEDNVWLIEFFMARAEAEEKEGRNNQWIAKLKEAPFLFDNSGVLRSPEDIYFFVEHFDEALAGDINMLHKKVAEGMESKSECYVFLYSLGVRFPKSVELIEKSIIGNQDFVHKYNAIDTGRYVFDAHKNQILKDKHYAKLRRLKLLTTKGKLIPAEELFLADIYEPKLRLEELHVADVYVSEKYKREEDLVSEWKTFLLKIGVKQDIEIVRYRIDYDYDKKWERRTDYPFLNTIWNISRRFKWITGGPMTARKYEGDKATYGFWPNYITFSAPAFFKHTANYKFSKLFLERLISTIDPEKLQNINLRVEGKTGTVHRNLSSKELASENCPNNYFKWWIENKPVFPITQGRTEIASKIFLNKPEIKELAGAYLPVLDFDGVIPETWLELLPFRTSMELEDYLSILSTIGVLMQAYNEEHKRTIPNTVQKIYEKIIENYLGYKDRLKEWGANNKLLTKDGKTFLPPAELSVVTESGFNAKNLAACDVKDEQMLELLSCFGVRVIKNVIANVSDNRELAQGFKKQIEYCLPLIAALAVHKKKKETDWNTVFLKLKEKVAAARFYEVANISLSYEGGTETQSRSTWREDDKFYYVGTWYKPRILDGLVEPLGEFLSIRYVERDLSVLLSDNLEEGIKYLKEKYGEDIIAPIPEAYLQPSSTSLAAYEQRSSQNRVYNQKDANIGMKGERAVYEKLMQLYQQIYRNELLTSTQNGFKLGNKVEVNWLNMQQETSQSVDFVVTHKGRTTLIDSKATPGKTPGKYEFWLSQGNFEQLSQKGGLVIARVLNVLEAPEVYFIQMEQWNA